MRSENYRNYFKSSFMMGPGIFHSIYSRRAFNSSKKRILILAATKPYNLNLENVFFKRGLGEALDEILRRVKK